MSEPTQNKRILVTGIMFFYPLAGVGFQFLHYLRGLRDLGYEVFYVEDSGRLLFDPKINDMTYEPANNIAMVQPVLEEHGFGDYWALRVRGDQGWTTHGPWGHKIDELYKTSEAILNVTGGQELYEEHMQIPNRLYVESDPFSSQVGFVNGNQDFIEQLNGHNHHFTFGENIGKPDCLIPSTPYNWHTTRQPVSLDCWEPLPPNPDASFNTITTWSNKNKDVELNGEKYYWTKNYAWETFMPLPSLSAAKFELAVRASEETLQRLRAAGWGIQDAGEVSATLNRYRDYIRNSYGEFTVARDQYVRGRTGWSSDRSVCYLAAGRPVITQETGFGVSLPYGEGLFGFETMDDILTAVDAIRSDYPKQCRKAREIAEEFLDARKVVGKMMEEVGLA
jgi:hypothetical protein